MLQVSDAILIVIIIILVFILIKNSGKKNENPVAAPATTGSGSQAQTEGFGRESRLVQDIKIDDKTQTYENLTQKALDENYEYFATCKGGTKSALQTAVCNDKCDENAEDSFDFASKGQSYQDFVSSWALDDKVIENHMNFVKDRKGLGPEGEFVTGRTYSPDSHDSYDPIPWIGIRGRPQYVQQCNPTQVPDMDTNLFKGNRPFCFWT